MAGVTEEMRLSLVEWQQRALRAEKRLAQLDANPVGSHHGTPLLTNRDISLLEAYNLWVKIWFENGGNRNFCLPNHADWLKSRLFWRIRSGKKPLEYPPPRAFACPWYELIEIKGPHAAYDILEEQDGKMHIAGCAYEILGKTRDDKWKLGFGPYRFKAWLGPAIHKRNLATDDFPTIRKTVVSGENESHDEICTFIEYVGIRKRKGG